ncbi:glycosyltransferase family 4 protein [Candidatus Shapirobacteria bacterium]|jgi:glycosyltransferase involved in cell wall biosynthesis|nr:glycosyltransferase family 4 protein [Candidatus Shapirobacteria bacterium]
MDHKRRPVNVIYLSTYVPQKCGIATFTKDVTTAINLLNPHALAEIMAVIKPGENPDFPWEVKYKIHQQDLQTYLNAAKYINNSSVDILLVEHEFGIFGGDHGDYLVNLLERITKPVVLTCHTIIDNPNNEWGKSFKKLLPHIDAYIVMTHNSAEELKRLYKIPLKKIVVIPHGTPDIPLTPTETVKSKRRLQNRIIMGNINLLSENKGLDYNLEAVAKIAKIYPQILYLIIGQTHPSILEKDGEKYRNSLKKKIRLLNIQKNVRFVNRYVSLDELIDWLKVIDYYVTPYLDPQQSSSGALAYAIGAGKICISTPYIYAKEILTENRGILVPFHNSEAIADTIIKLEKNPALRSEIQNKAYKYGRFMTWSNVALQHLDLFSHLIKKHAKKSSTAN